MKKKQPDPLSWNNFQCIVKIQWNCGLAKIHKSWTRYMVYVIKKKKIALSESHYVKEKVKVLKKWKNSSFILETN